MNENISDYMREGLVSFYIFGFFIVLGASLGSFVYTFSGFLTFVLLFGCVVGCALLIKNAYFAGLHRGLSSRPAVNRRERQRNRATERIHRLNPNPPHLVVNNTKRDAR